MMKFTPMILLLALCAHSWPAALPYALAYFIVGGGIGAFFAWACRQKADPKLAAIAPVIVIWNMYAWPLALACMFFTYKPKGAAK